MHLESIGYRLTWLCAVVTFLFGVFGVIDSWMRWRQTQTDLANYRTREANCRSQDEPGCGPAAGDQFYGINPVREEALERWNRGARDRVLDWAVLTVIVPPGIFAAFLLLRWLLTGRLLPIRPPPRE